MARAPHGEKRLKECWRLSPTAVIASALAASAILTGCGGDKDAAEKPSPSASSITPTESADPDAKDKADVLAVYRHYWDEQVKAYAQASSEGTDLTKYAADKALAQANGELVVLGTKGRAYKGKPTISPKVTALDTSKQPKEATITDCIDVKNWRPVTKKTGKPVPLPSERLTRFVTTVSARTIGDRWMIVKAQPQDRAC